MKGGRGVAKLILPFTVPSRDRGEPLRRDMELASIFALAEIDRDKGGGLISKKTPERIRFLSEVCYPLWLVPWKDRTLLFDGFGMMKYSFSFHVIPDAGVFLNELKGSSDRCETYLNFLSNNLDYFNTPLGSGRKVINGLVADPKFIEEFAPYLDEAVSVKGALEGRLILSPIINRVTLKSLVKGITYFTDALERDLKRLQYIADTLKATTQRHIRAIEEENEKIQRRFELEIKRFHARTEKRIEELREAYNKRIARVTRNGELQVKSLQERRLRLEERRDHLLDYSKKCEVEISSSKLRNDEDELAYWNQELERCRKELSEINKRLVDIDKRIRGIEASKSIQISKMESRLKAQIGSIKTGVEKIERARDLKVRANKETIKSLEELTSAVVSQVNKLLRLRKQELNEFTRIGLLRTRRRPALVYLPFFLACYVKDSERRYKAFTPSIVNSLGAAVKLRGRLGTLKIRSLLKERSLSISNLINRFIDMVERNPLFEEKIIDAGVRTSIIRTRRRIDVVKAGLEALRDEGWLSEVEFSSLLERLP